jgi:hypothetical protein
MPAKLGMVFSSGYANNSLNAQNNVQSNVQSNMQNNVQSNVQSNMQNNTSSEEYQLKRMRLCMDLYGLMKTKPCGSCGGNG